MENQDTKLAIILVCWNGWRDTIECLESILKNPPGKWRVYVCDNASTDGSFDRIIAWANGEEICVPASEEMASFSQPQSKKPVPLRIIDEQLKKGDPKNTVLTLIQTGANMGFAGGNNVGIRQAMTDDEDFTHFWLLNNDTVIAGNAIENLETYVNNSSVKSGAALPVGQTGTKINFYHSPGLTQAMGGASFNFWTGTSQNLTENNDSQILSGNREYCERASFIVGASLCVSRKFVDNIGFMSEDYFLYFEEIDWAIRGQNRFDLAYADSVTIFHKEGGSIGSSSMRNNRSELSEYYLAASKILFFKKYFPKRLFAIYLYSLMQMILRFFSGKPNLAKSVFNAVIGQSRKNS